MAGHPVTGLGIAAVPQLPILGGGLLLAGGFAGLAAGLMGVGGGIVIVPVLYHLFTALGVDEAVRMHVAVGTSLATIIATSLTSLRAHRRRGAVDGELLRAWGPAIFLGVLAGTAVAGVVRGPVLTAVFAAMAVLVTLHMLFGKADWRIADGLPSGAPRQGLAGGIGMMSAMMGIGGGTLSVPILTLFGYPIHRAVGTAAALGFIIGVPGTVGFVLTGWNVPGRPDFSLGYVNLLGLALILPASMAMAPLGARLAHSLDTRVLRRVFALFLGLTAARMIYGLLP
ncbi:sulfite exporter TauE/SafE family protein [Azospirillum sp. TSH58]|uniref:sulfite exporter TauE/SafE family protein n=1 Tax=Azospirillum sp. TSH58 TaxID=664962 RepID=UPI001FFF4D60|nr:sulfite exporter TauE/SafE family protein [Azospirillum sp. TSH58]